MKESRLVYADRSFYIPNRISSMKQYSKTTASFPFRTFRKKVYKVIKISQQTFVLVQSKSDNLASKYFKNF